VIVLAIETSTPQSSVAIGTETGILGSVAISAGRGHQEVLAPSLERLLEWTGLSLSQVGGIATGVGPGLFTGLRVGVETAKSLAQVLMVPIVGLPSLDSMAFEVRHSRRLIVAVIDARRREVFYAFYRPVPGGVTRESEYAVAPPGHLAADIEAAGEEVLLVGNGAILYRKVLEELGSGVEFASPTHGSPHASALVELSIPRFLREEFDRPHDVVPLYLRKSDAEIHWDQRAGGV
jgi:tRNA threonylcarbamoyladenosine biosynthesis protein TsaB